MKNYDIFFSPSNDLEPFKIKTGWAAEFTEPSGNLLGITDYKND